MKNILKVTLLFSLMLSVSLLCACSSTPKEVAEDTYYDQITEGFSETEGTKISFTTLEEIPVTLTMDGKGCLSKIRYAGDDLGYAICKYDNRKIDIKILGMQNEKEYFDMEMTDDNFACGKESYKEVKVAGLYGYSLHEHSTFDYYLFSEDHETVFTISVQSRDQDNVEDVVKEKAFLNMLNTIVVE